MHLVDDVRAALAAAGDPDRAAGQQAYMRSPMPFRGVTATDGRRVVNALVTQAQGLDREAWEGCIRALYDDASYREERYAAITLLRHRRYRPFRDASILPLIEHLVVEGAWWDLVDSCQPVVTEVLLADPDAVRPWLRSWARDEDLWLRRSAIIAQLGAKERTDTVLLAEVIEANLADPDFFCRKAIGWALRQHARTDPVWVRAFVRSHGLSPLSRREALRHLQPS